MLNRKLYRQVAKLHGVSVKEVNALCRRRLTKRIKALIHTLLALSPRWMR